jgi:hypothetical protein
MPSKYVTNEKERQNAKFMSMVKPENKNVILEFIRNYDMNHTMTQVISDTMKMGGKCEAVVRAIERALIQRNIYITSIIDGF